jgi:pentatricopeptide repeat protein
MSLAGLRRVAQRSSKPNINKSIKSAASITIRHGMYIPFRHVFRLIRQTIASSTEQIQRRLYDSNLIRLAHTSQDVVQLNNRLRPRADDRNIGGLIRIWNLAIKNNVRPDALSYITLLRGFASCGLFDDTVRVFKDMLEMGVGDRLLGLNYVLQVRTYFTRPSRSNN